MPAHSDEIVQQIRTEFEALLTNLLNTAPDQKPTADAIERHLWEQMLRLGCSLMTLVLVGQAEAVAPPSLTTQQAQNLPYHDDKERTYHTVFGEIGFARRDYYRPGNGAFARDASLNLPPEATSDLLREWPQRLGMYVPYPQADALRQSMLGRPFPSRFLQAAIVADAAQVEAFYEQADPHLPDPNATILVVQADGKGVPMLSEPTEAPVRRSKGQKPCRKKEAIVTSVSTLAPPPARQRVWGPASSIRLGARRPPPDPSPITSGCGPLSLAKRRRWPSQQSKCPARREPRSAIGWR